MMRRPFLVFEDTSPGARQELFRLFGVTWAATRYAWLGPLVWIALGVVIAASEEHTVQGWGSMLRGVGYGFLLIATNVLHTLGHIAAGRLAGSPMAVNVLTSTRDVNVYREPGASAPPRLRRLRSLGGPAANLVAGIAALAAARLLGSRGALMFGYMNIVVALWTIVPVPTMDGWVLWRAGRKGGNHRYFEVPDEHGKRLG
jgi:Zn-dependent protease